MYSTYFLPFIVQHYRICQKIFKYYPFQFDPKLKRFICKNTSPRGEKMLRLLYLVMLSYTLFVSCHLCLMSMPLAKKIQGFVFCLIFLIVTGSSWTWNVLDKAEIQMINTCLEFEDKILDGM